jgi:hypothetical protein
MSSAVGFLLVFVAIYAAECCVWVPPGGYLALAWRAGRPRLLTGRGLFFKNPFPAGFAFRLLPRRWRLGRCGLHGLARDGRSWQGFVTYGDLAQARVSGPLLFLRDGREMDAGSAASAVLALDAGRALSACPPDQREARVRSLLRQGMDPSQVERAVQESARALRPLAWGGRALLLLGLAAPLLWFLHVDRLLVWGIWGLAFLLAHFAQVALLARAHGQLRPGKRGERWAYTLMALASPWQSSRGLDLLQQGALEGRHPLAVAKALGVRADLQALASELARHAAHPAAWEWPADAAERAGLDWGRLQELAVLQAWCQEQGLDWQALLAAPTREAHSRAWCPRCQAQYQLAQGQCGDCQVELVAY